MRRGRDVSSVRRRSSVAPSRSAIIFLCQTGPAETIRFYSSGRAVDGGTFSNRLAHAKTRCLGLGGAKRRDSSFTVVNPIVEHRPRPLRENTLLTDLRSLFGMFMEIPLLIAQRQLESGAFQRSCIAARM